MDNSPDGISPDLDTLPYDDTIAYEEQVPTHPPNDPDLGVSLANRIGSTKLYLLSETSVARVGKRKHAEEDEYITENDDDMDEDLTYRANALLLQGPPISHLPTARLFAYAKHFDVQPMGLEWVDDTTCVLVFSSKATAQVAHHRLQKSSTGEADADGFVTAKSLPITLWPPEERINNSLGKGQGLKGIIKMRWALHADVKKKGAKRESDFYKKHGKMAGKEVYDGEGVPPVAKRQRSVDTPPDPELQRAQLDEELDQFLAEDDSEPETTPPSPPSKMRSDYIASDGRTLLERTSVIRMYPETLASRLTAPLPRRARNGTLGQLRSSEPEDPSMRTRSEKLEWGKDSRSRDNGPATKRARRGNKPPQSNQPRKMTRQELDDEIDAFLNEKE